MRMIIGLSVFVRMVGAFGVFACGMITLGMVVARWGRRVAWMILAGFVFVRGMPCIVSVFSVA